MRGNRCGAERIVGENSNSSMCKTVFSGMDFEAIPRERQGGENCGRNSPALYAVSWNVIL